jgi:Ankyrin repeats (3 copies)
MLGDLDYFDPLTRSTSRYGNNPLFAFSVWHVTEVLEDPGCTHPGRWMETNERGFTVIEDFWRHLDLASSVTESDPTTRSLFSQAVQQHTIFMSSLIERTPIHQQAEAVRLLLSLGACLDPPHLTSHTNPLHIAAAKATGEVVELLLAYGAKVDAIDSWGNTALHHAVMANNVDAIPAILRGNACLTIENFGGDTALMSSLKAGDPSAVILILFHMQKTGGYERNLAAVLHLAARRAGQDALAMIVEAGVDIDLDDEDGKDCFADCCL